MTDSHLSANSLHLARRSIDWLDRDTETLHLTMTEQELREAAPPD